jgi:type I restriction enzyme R subunit
MRDYKPDFNYLDENCIELSNDELMGFFNPNNTKDNIQEKFNEEIDGELLNFINNKLELYNKLTEDRTNTMFKQLWFNQLYDQRVRGLRL